MLTIGAAFYELKEQLRALYDDGEATAIAHEVLEHVTSLGRLARISQKEQTLSDVQTADFQRIKGALISGSPLQYALGTSYFMGRPFKVSPAVLIPRPETEELVQWIVEDTGPLPASILDIGTGSGCIAISLRLALPMAVVTAIDVSKDALAVAKENAAALGAEVSLRELDFLQEEVRNSELMAPYYLIVSNPPYIPVAERERLHANVREHEPATALFVPDEDALIFYRAIADYGKAHLKDGGSIYCELHQDYAEDTAAMFADAGYGSVELREDMHGNPRMLRVRR